jgi:hypothetical protein
MTSRWGQVALTPHELERSPMNHCNPVTTRLGRVISSALVIAAIAAPAAPAAARQDLRSPDARDAARAATVVQDLRPPDVRDAAQPRFTPSQRLTPASPASRPVVASASGPTGFPWLEAGALLVAIGLGTATLRRRRFAARA